MIKAKITHNDMNIDLECSNPSEFVDVVNGVFKKVKTLDVKEVKTPVRDYSHSAKAKKHVKYYGWTEKDVVLVGKMIMENRDDLRNITRKIQLSLSTHGDVTNRNFGKIFSKVSEVKKYLFNQGGSKVPKVTRKMLTDNNIYPLDTFRVNVNTQEA